MPWSVIVLLVPNGAARSQVNGAALSTRHPSGCFPPQQPHRFFAATASASLSSATITLAYHYRCQGTMLQ